MSERSEAEACVWTHKSGRGVCGEENVHTRRSTQQQVESAIGGSPSAQPLHCLLSGPVT